MVEQPNKILMGKKRIKSLEFITIIVIIIQIIGMLHHIAGIRGSVID
jgi:hypothetical protein